MINKNIIINKNEQTIFTNTIDSRKSEASSEDTKIAALFQNILTMQKKGEQPSLNGEDQKVLFFADISMNSFNGRFSETGFTEEEQKTLIQFCTNLNRSIQPQLLDEEIKELIEAYRADPKTKKSPINAKITTISESVFNTLKAEGKLSDLWEAFPNFRVGINLKTNDENSSKSISYSLLGREIKLCGYFQGSLRFKENIIYDAHNHSFSFSLTPKTEEEYKCFKSFFDLLAKIEGKPENLIRVLVEDKIDISSIEKTADFFNMESFIYFIEFSIQSLSLKEADIALEFFNLYANEEAKKIYNSFMSEIQSNYRYRAYVLLAYGPQNKYSNIEDILKKFGITLTLEDKSKGSNLSCREIGFFAEAALYQELKKDTNKVSELLESLLSEEMGLTKEERRLKIINVRQIFDICDLIPELYENAEIAKKVILTFERSGFDFLMHVKESVKEKLKNDVDIINILFKDRPSAQTILFILSDIFTFFNVFYSNLQFAYTLLSIWSDSSEPFKEELFSYIEKLDPTIWDNTDFVITAIEKKCPISFLNSKVSKEVRNQLQSKPYIIKIIQAISIEDAIHFVTEKDISTFKQLPSSLLESINVGIALFQSGKYNHLLKDFFNKPDFMEELIKLAPSSLLESVSVGIALFQSGKYNHLLKDFFNRSDFMEELIKLAPSNIKYASSLIKNDLEFIYDQIVSSYYSSDIGLLKAADIVANSSLSESEALFVKLVNFDPQYIALASENIKQSIKVAVHLIENKKSHPSHLRYLHASIKENPQIYELAVKRYGPEKNWFTRMDGEVNNSPSKVKVILKKCYPISVMNQGIPRYVSSNELKYEYIKETVKSYPVLKKIKLIALTISSVGLNLFSAKTREKWALIFESKKISVMYGLKKEEQKAL